MRILLVSPISPTIVGVGLAGRVRQWKDSLEALGEVSVVVIPVAGPAKEGDTTVSPGPDTDTTLPRLARGLTEQWGARYGGWTADIDVIVAVRSYLGLFALGLSGSTNIPVVVDLDDDDASYFRQRGDVAEAERFDKLVNRLRERGSLCVSASGFDGTVRIPNSVPIPEPRSPEKADVARGLLVGNFRYEPNAEGAQWFIQEVLPFVRKFSPDFELRLVGPGSQKFEPFGVGTVDDLADEYARASVALCPILTGSGTRTKIIEAWMYQVPVVSTEIGAEGLAASSGEHLLISDTPVGFSDQIRKVLTDPDFAQRLTSSAHALAVNEYAPSVVTSAIERVIRPLATEQPRFFVISPNLHITETEDGLVVLNRNTDAVHSLNSTASMILMLADGTTGQEGIAQQIQSALKLVEPPLDFVSDAIDRLSRLGLISIRLQSAPSTGSQRL